MLLADLEVHASGWQLTRNPKIQNSDKLMESGERGPPESLKRGYEGAAKGSQGGADWRELRQLRTENGKLKRLVAALSLDRHCARDRPKKL